MIEADVPSTEVLQVQIGMMCASHRGGHGLTIDDATQRFKGAKRRPRQTGGVKRGQQYTRIIKAGTPRRITPALVVLVAAGLIGAWLSILRAAAAPIGSFSLLAVIVYVADEYPAAYAGVGAQALQT